MPASNGARNLKKQFKTPFKVPFKEAPQNIESDKASTKQHRVDEISKGVEDSVHVVRSGPSSSSSRAGSPRPPLPVSSKSSESQGSERSQSDTQTIEIDSDGDERQSKEVLSETPKVTSGPADLFADYERELNEEDVSDRRHDQVRGERRTSYSRKFRLR